VGRLRKVAVCLKLDWINGWEDGCEVGSEGQAEADLIDGGTGMLARQRQAQAGTIAEASADETGS